MADSEIKITGRLTRDPELKFTPNGTAVCNASLAMSVQKKEGDKYVDDHTEFFNLTAWGRRAELLALMPKGTMLRVEGRMNNRPWEDKDGSKRTSADITVDLFSLPVLTDKTLRIEGNEIHFIRAGKKEAPVDNGIEEPLSTGTYDEEPF